MSPLRVWTAALVVGALLVVPASAARAANDEPHRTVAATAVPQLAIRSVARLTALGDSVPSGGACNCTPFPPRVAGMLAARAGHGVLTHNDAVSGLTTQGLLNQLLHNAAVRRDVAGSSVVLVTIGANDISSPKCNLVVACYAPIVRRVGTLLDAIVHQIKVCRSATPTAIIITGYWNVWRDGAVARARGAAYVAASVALTKAVNAQILAAARRDGATYTDLWVPFRGTTNLDDTALLAADGDHPNARGHVVIAVAISQALARRIPA